MRTIEEIALLLEKNGYNPKDIDFPCFCKNGIGRDKCWAKSLSKVREICNAERDGRLVVLPCEVGSDIYWINEENEVKCHKNGVRGIVIRKDKILIEDTDGYIDEIGTEYCYLSREEAEKALKGGAE